MAPPNRPNIVYLFTDQQSAFAMSCAGNPYLSTPHMDRLAREGVRFQRAYCTQPLCTPSRASMFTGLMPHECGAPRNGLAIQEDLRAQGLGRLLRAGGYECVYSGKWHVPEIAMPEENDHGFTRICGFDDHRLAEACCDYLAGPARRPFFLVAGFDNPHNICEWGRNMPLPWGAIGDPPPLEECPNLPANFQPSPFEPEAVRLEQQAHWGIYPYQERPPEDWRRLRWAYYRLVEKVDREIGKVLAALEEHGLSEDTVVILSSDHGDGHGAHRWNQKSALFEEIVRIPLIVRAPDGQAGLVSPELVSNGLDLLPTVCDYAGLAAPEGLRGLSLRPLVEGSGDGPWREQLPIETVFDGGRGYDTEGRAILAGRHKYVVYDRGRYREQLFDLQEDPGETANLAVEARHRDLLDEFHGRLAVHIEATGDRFRVPGSGDGHGWKW